jgi:hypothetical protein
VREDTLRQTCVFNLVGSVGRVVYSGVSGSRHLDALFFMLGTSGAVSIKSASGLVVLNLCFCIPVARNDDAIFFMLDWD